MELSVHYQTINMTVFIITRCLNIVNDKAALLVFNSIRIGFPTFDIQCIYLGDYQLIKQQIFCKCQEHKITFVDYEYKFKTNNEVIEYLVSNCIDDFVVVDSDVVFHKNLEWYKPTKCLAGRYIPQYFEKWLNCETIERLHTSLLYFTNLPNLKALIKDSFKQECDGIFTPYNVFNPVVTKYKGTTYLYDTCSILYHAIGGEAFGADVIDCYTHISCGAYQEEVTKNNPELKQLFDGVYADINKAKAVGKQIQQYFFDSTHRFTLDEINNILSIEAKKFLVAYNEYGHAVDDIIDLPLSNGKVEEATELSYRVFSSNYWCKNKAYLYLVQELIQVLYYNSVEWEKSMDLWKRRDAKVLSHCGYFMLLAILLMETQDIKLVKKLSLKILENSHLQHLEDLTLNEQLA